MEKQTAWKLEYVERASRKIHLVAPDQVQQLVY